MPEYISLKEVRECPECDYLNFSYTSVKPFSLNGNNYNLIGQLVRKECLRCGLRIKEVRTTTRTNKDQLSNRSPSRFET